MRLGWLFALFALVLAACTTREAASPPPPAPPSVPEGVSPLTVEQDEFLRG